MRRSMMANVIRSGAMFPKQLSYLLTRNATVAGGRVMRMYSEFL